MRDLQDSMGHHLTSEFAYAKESPPFVQRLESHPWFDVGRPLDGDAALTRLRAQRHDSASRVTPYCIYVHVPFCASICSYCALYTRAVRGNADAVFDEYLERLSQAIAQHPYAHSGSGPTTVHFGGGTPLHIGLARFASLTHALRAAFGDPPTCEWAVETTTSALAGDVVEMLADLGFRRIHLGIQTLDDCLRKHYGRRESGKAAIEKIRFLVERGFRCSVDLIIGFDDSSEAILLDDLKRLYEGGIRMFSICELRQRAGPVLTASEHEAQIWRNFRLWKIVWNFMARCGLKPIHLGQFASTQADNLYYTHPARGEDCVALGPYAHGSAGRLYYSNKLSPAYYQAIRTGASAIDRAVWYGDELEPLRALERELLAHQVNQRTIDTALKRYSLLGDILAFWQDRRLLHREAHSATWGITLEGSWFVGNMIEQIRGLVGEEADAPIDTPDQAAFPTQRSPSCS